MLSESKHQVINLSNCCIWLVNLFELYDDARTCQRQILRIFERRILRRIFGPVQNEDGSRRIKMNYELNELIENAGIVDL